MTKFRNGYPSWFCSCIVFILSIFAFTGCQPEERWAGCDYYRGGYDSSSQDEDTYDNDCDKEEQEEGDDEDSRNSDAQDNENADYSGSGGKKLNDFNCSVCDFSSNAVLKFFSNFDRDSSIDSSGVKKKLYNGSKIGLTSEDSRHYGGKSIKFNVGQPQLSHSQCTSGSYRSEIVTKDNARLYPWDDGKSYWIGVSLNPQDFESDAYTFLQIHAPMPDGDASCGYDGNSITIRPLASGGRVYYEVRAIEDGGRTADKGALSNSKSVYKSPMNEGQWADFVINFTLSSKGRGFFRVWHDGNLVYQKCGLTNVNYIDGCGRTIPSNKRVSNGPHIGIYGPACQSEGNHRRVLLADNISVAMGGNEGYSLVDPSKEKN